MKKIQNMDENIRFQTFDTLYCTLTNINGRILNKNKIELLFLA